MKTTIPVRTAVVTAQMVATALLLMALLLTVPSGARASESPYCGGQNLPAGGACAGAPRAFNALYGLGSQQSVCVFPSLNSSGTYPVSQVGCSPGAGQGVYVPEGTFWLENIFWPGIRNNGGGASVVYGVAFKP